MARHYGMAQSLSQEHGNEWFMNGSGLQPTGRFAVVGFSSRKVFGRTDDPVYALAWVRAAEQHCLMVEVIEC